MTRWRLDSDWGVPPELAQPWRTAIDGALAETPGVVEHEVTVVDPAEEDDAAGLLLRIVVEAVSAEAAVVLADDAVRRGKEATSPDGAESGWTQTEWATEEL